MNEIAKITDTAIAVPRPPSPQALFDRIVRGVRRSGYLRSTRGEESCAYRGRGGTKCLVGHAIDDRLYLSEFEGKTPEDLRRLGLCFVDLDARAIELLSAMQAIHDDLDPELWEGEFERLAVAFRLRYRAKRGKR